MNGTEIFLMLMIAIIFLIIFKIWIDWMFDPIRKRIKRFNNRADKLLECKYDKL